MTWDNCASSQSRAHYTLQRNQGQSVVVVAGVQGRLGEKGDQENTRRVPTVVSLSLLCQPPSRRHGAGITLNGLLLTPHAGSSRFSFCRLAVDSVWPVDSQLPSLQGQLSVLSSSGIYPAVVRGSYPHLGYCRDRLCSASLSLIHHCPSRFPLVPKLEIFFFFSRLKCFQGNWVTEPLLIQELTFITIIFQQPKITSYNNNNYVAYVSLCQPCSWSPCPEHKQQAPSLFFLLPFQLSLGSCLFSGSVFPKVKSLLFLAMYFSILQSQYKLTVASLAAISVPLSQISTNHTCNGSLNLKSSSHVLSCLLLDGIAEILFWHTGHMKFNCGICSVIFGEWIMMEEPKALVQEKKRWHFKAAIIKPYVHQSENSQAQGLLHLSGSCCVSSHTPQLLPKRCGCTINVCRMRD